MKQLFAKGFFSRWKLYLNILCYIMVVIILTIVASPIAMILMQVLQLDQVYQTFILQFVLLIAVVATTYIFVVLKDKQPFSIIGFRWKGYQLHLLYGLLVAVAMYGVGFGISLLMGVVSIESVHFSLRNLSLSFLFFVMVSLTEEILCRGYLLGHLLKGGVNRWYALLLTSVIFAMMHLFNPGISILSMINLVIAGCMLGVTYIYHQNLWFPISLHLFWNWVQGPVLGYEVSGTNVFGSLFQLNLAPHNIWNGGAFGFEGSIICTLLMLLFILSVYLYYRTHKVV